jgi:hypothetical protein
MKAKLLNMLPYLLVLAVDFYLLPLLAQNTGAAMLLMLCVMPLVALVIGVAYGLRRGFSIWLAVIALLLFIPTIFIYYNASAWVYPLFYALLVLVGNLIGRLFYMKR